MKKRNRNKNVQIDFCVVLSPLVHIKKVHIKKCFSDTFQAYYVLYSHCLLSSPRAQPPVKLTVPGANSRQQTNLVLYRYRLFVVVVFFGLQDFAYVKRVGPDTQESTSFSGVLYERRTTII